MPKKPAKEKVPATPTPEEKKSMAKELRQRLGALLAVLGVVIFFWFSFHQNGMPTSWIMSWRRSKPTA